MNVHLIYFDKIVLEENNKFTLDFSDEEFVQKIKFDKKITTKLRVWIVV